MQIPARVRKILRLVASLVFSRLALLIVITVLGLLLQAAHAATITVNALQDGGAGCTLRKAVANANAGAAPNPECAAGGTGANTVVLPAGTHLLNLPAINLLNRPITLMGSGAGVIIDAQNLTRIFDNFDEGGGAASTAITITLQNLTLTRGNANTTTGDFDSGPAMYIENNATASVTGVTFSNNVAQASAGAIFNNGALTISNSSFTGNAASLAGEGGAIRNNGTLTVNNSTFQGNQSGTGGAIYHTSNNAALTLTVLNSTFSGNTGAQRGGAIAANNPAAPSAITLTHVTVTGNNSPLGGGIYKNQTGAFNIDRSIIAGNNGTTGVDCSTTSSFNSLNFNVIGSASGCVIAGTTTNNFTGAALLAPLANNGGQTLTVALQPYSPARDRAPTCASATDQRGFARPIGLACDSGAFEAIPTVAQAPTIGTVTAGTGQATIPFTAPANNGGANITQYLAVASPGGATVSGTVSPITFPGLTGGTTYTFVVRAINSAGPSADSATSNSVTPISVSGQPTGATAMPGNTTASVSFTPPASNGGSTITSYTAVSNPGGFQATAAAAPIIVTGLTNGTAYFFTVRANNAAGSSLASAPSNTVTPFVPVPPGFTSAAPPGGTLNTPYNYSVTATGTPPPIFNVTTGALPPGLSLAPGSGLISGTPTAAGTFTGVITAGNGVGPGATQPFSINIGLQSQSITFPGAVLVVGVPFNMSATGGGSGNPVTYTSTSPATCAVSGVNGVTVTATATFSCSVVANQAGNATYNAAAPVTQTFPVFPGSQAIVFGAAPVLVFGGSATVSATGGASGNVVTFTSATSTVCTISGSTVTAIDTGDCTINANQAGNASYNAAPQAAQTFTIGKAGQQIVFGVDPVIIAGSSGAMSATGGASGNAVVFTSSTPAVCTTSGANGQTVNGLAVGNCSIDANQAGDTHFNAAPQITRTFAIGPVPTAFTGNVYSRKTHGNGAGVHDLPLADATIDGAFTVEPRASEGGSHQIVFRFSSPVNSVGGISVTDAASANLTNPVASFSGNDLIVTLSGVADRTRVTISVTGVNGLVDVSRAVGFMVGDVNSNRYVNAADLSAIKARASATVNGGNFIFDINLSGAIDAADLLAAKARTALAIP